MFNCTRISLNDVCVTEPEEAMIRGLAVAWSGWSPNEINVEIVRRFGGVPRRANIIYSWIMLILDYDVVA